MIDGSVGASCGTNKRLTYPQRSHRGSLGVDLIDICQPSRQCVGGDLVPIFISPVGSLLLSARYLCFCIS
jgi:hypothetical protein